MRIEQLYYLSEIKKTNSITLTSKRIHVSQQNISVAIHKLEEELGFDILYRSSRGVTLTEEGEKFADKAEGILQQLDDLITEFQVKANNKPSLEGNLSIIVTPFFYNSILPDIVIELKRQHPKIAIHIEKVDLEDISSEIIKDKEIDFAIGYSMNHVSLENDDEIEYEHLFTDKVLACAGKSSSLASRKSISLSTIMEQPIVLLNTSKNIILREVELLMPGNLDYQKNLFIVNSLHVYKKTIMEGHAVGFILGATFQRQYMFKKDEIVAIPIRDFPMVNAFLMKPSRRPYSPAAEAFISILRTNIVGL